MGKKSIKMLSRYYSILCLEMTHVGVIGLDLLSCCSLSPSLNYFGGGGDLLKTLTSCSFAARLLALDANSVGVG